MSDSGYNPRRYWEQRLQTNFTLSGVGHAGFTERYNYWIYRRKADVIEHIFSGVDLRGKQVMDVGCGTGFFLKWYSKKGANVTGIDITEVSIRKLSRMFPGSLYVQDITDEGYISARIFDIVNMWDVMYHIVDEDAFCRALDNITKSLTPSGLFICTDWFTSAVANQITSHVKARNIQIYNKEMVRRGFSLRNIFPLYHVLNRAHIRRIDNWMGAVYYAIDRFQHSPSPSNLSVAVWQLGEEAAKERDR